MQFEVVKRSVEKNDKDKAIKNFNYSKQFFDNLVEVKDLFLIDEVKDLLISLSISNSININFKVHE